MTSWDEFLEAVDGTESDTQLPNCSFLGAADLNNIKGDKLAGLNIRGLKSNHASLADFFDGLNRPQDVKILTLTKFSTLTRQKKTTTSQLTTLFPQFVKRGRRTMGE